MNKGNSIYIIIIVILTLIVLGLSYYTFFGKKNEKVENTDIVELALEDKDVKKLYGYFNNADIKSLTSFGESKEGVYTISNMSKSEMNFIAYLSLNKEDYLTVQCSKYSQYSDPGELKYCGSSEGDGDADVTKAIKGTVLKNMVEKIFGVGSYKAEKFTLWSTEYYYVEDSSAKLYFRYFSDSSWSSNATSSCVINNYKNEDLYIEQGQPNGGNDPYNVFKLSKAYKKGSELVIEVLHDTDAESEENVDKYNFVYIYTFELINDNYIFKSLEKKFV